jgi:NADPH:quinone reductase-like Zn-dependent oxidoreductase
MWRTLCAFTGGRTDIAEEDVAEASLAPWHPLLERPRRTVGVPAVTRSATVLREGGRLVSVAEEPPDEVARSVRASYFVVEPDRGQLTQLAKLVDREAVRPAIDSVYPLTEARAAFERLMTPGKRGKVVLEVIQ